MATVCMYTYRWKPSHWKLLSVFWASSDEVFCQITNFAYACMNFLPNQKLPKAIRFHRYIESLTIARNMNELHSPRQIRFTEQILLVKCLTCCSDSHPIIECDISFWNWRELGLFYFVTEGSWISVGGTFVLWDGEQDHSVGGHIWQSWRRICHQSAAR